MLIIAVFILFLVWSADSMAKSLKRIATSLEKIEAHTSNSTSNNQTFTNTTSQVNSAVTSNLDQ